MKKRRKQRKNSRIPHRYWFWSLFWLTLAIIAIACSHRLTPLGSSSPASALHCQTSHRQAPPPVSSDVSPFPDTPSGVSLSDSAPSSVLSSGHLELPALSVFDTVICNTAGRYTFSYRPSGKIARWVAYKLTRSDLSGAADRSDSFAPDPLLSVYGWHSATHSDYRGSGYDRGHLLPSADRTDSEASNRSTFLYSNMAPQLPKLNRGPWKRLEERLRAQTSDYDTLYIVVGTVLPSRPRTIGRGVVVPELFFKAVALRRADVFESAAYVMPNEVSRLAGQDYTAFEVPLDSVERLSGLDLFPCIPQF